VTGRVHSLQVGRPRSVEHAGGLVSTAIFKDAVAGPVRLTTLGFVGDGQADPEHHGGPNQAAYAYPREHYAHWAPRFPDRIGEPGLFGENVDRIGEPGLFGENVTTEGLLEGDVHFGDVFRLGAARVQVTTPRVPCFKLGIRTGDPAIIEPFLSSGRLGFYLRVLEEGDVAPGDPIERVSVDPHGLTMAALIAALFLPLPAPAEIERILAVPTLHPKHRARLEARRAGR
jgi:MOSC domain-containing protein YiiM